MNTLLIPTTATRVVIREITCQGECQHTVDVYSGGLRMRYSVAPEQSSALHDQLTREGWTVIDVLHPRGGVMTYYGRHGA